MHFSKVNTNYQALRRAKFYFTDDLAPVYRLSGLEAEIVKRRRAASKVDVDGMIQQTRNTASPKLDESINICFISICLLKKVYCNFP